MPDQEWTIDELKRSISSFVQTREASELMERFQWVEESSQILDEGKARIEEEVADIAIFLLNLCTLNDIDLGEAVCNQLVKHAERCPVSKSKRQEPQVH